MKLHYPDLERHLEREGAAPAYVVTGDQDLLREIAVRKIRQRAVGDEPTPFNYERFDGERTSARDIVDSANLLPMLGGARLVVVTRAQKLLSAAEEIPSYLASPSLTTVLVLVLEKPPDRRRKAWKEVERNAVVVTCDAPRDAELTEWVVRQSKDLGLRVGRESARYLVNEFGSDLRRLSNELEKLSLYASGQPIDLETVTTVLGRGRAQSVFKFTDAVAEGDASKALRLLGRLIEEGEPPLKILALVDRLVGQLRVAREAGASSGGGELARVLGVPPFVAKNLGRQGRRFDANALRRAAVAVADADRSMKSSSIPERVALEGLVVRLCGDGVKKRTSRARSTAQPGERVASRRLRRDL